MLIKRVSQIYLWAMLALFPLVIHDHLFDILATKHYFFFGVTFIYLMAVIIDDIRRDVRWTFRRLDFFVLAFLLVMFCSTLFSIDYFASWGGQNGRLQGLLTYLMYGGLYFALSRHATVDRSLIFPAVVGVGGTAVLACLNYYQIDPLGIYTQMSPDNYFAFISTVGNINFYSAYLCLMVPFLAIHFAMGEGKERLAGIGALLGMLGLACANTDSGLVALGVVLLLAIGFLGTHLLALRRFLALVALGLVGMSIVVNASYFFPHYMETSTLFLTVFHPVFLILMLLCLGLLYLGMARTHLANWYWKILGGCVLLGVLFLLFVNTLGRFLDLGALNDYLRFGKSWASYRGMTWIYTWKVYASAGIKEWLIGTGPETFASLTEQAALFGDLVLDAAHNVYLQLLVTTGILGLGTYLGMFGEILKENLAKGKHLALCLAILCYLMQDLTNIAQPSSTPLLFVFFGLLACSGASTFYVDSPENK